MRNDAHDELDHVPSLRADQRDHDHDDYAADHPEPARGNAYGRAAVAAPVKSASTGPLWALVGALMIALGGLGWWSFQQISLMEQQLVATQESFARISEEAAGRIQDISGKVVATESSVTSGSEALKLQVKQLESKLAEQSKFDEKIAGLRSEIDALKKQGNSSQAIARVEQDLLVLKSDLETRSAGSSTAEFDAFRAQMTRNISTLQAQVLNLQQKIDAR